MKLARLWNLSLAERIKEADKRILLYGATKTYICPYCGQKLHSIQEFEEHLAKCKKSFR